MIKPLGKILIECGFITNMQLGEALIKQKESGGSKRMGDIFLEMGVLSSEHLEIALKKQQESVNHPGIRKTFGAAQPALSFRAPAAPPGGGYPLPPAQHGASQFRQPPVAPQPYPVPHVPQPASQAKDSKELLALAQLLIKKGVITMEEYFREIQGK